MRFKVDRNIKSENKKENSSVDFLYYANERLVKEKIKDLEARALVNPRKVTDEQVKKIKELRALGLSYRAIVKEVGLSTCTIQRALNGLYDE